VPWRFPGLLAAVVALACVPGRAARTPDPPVLRYHDQRLTVRLNHVPLDEVVQLFAKETGAEIHGEPVDLREVTKRFDSVPVQEAFGRLLGAQNFVMRYGVDGRLLAVDLLGAPQPRPGPRQASPSPLSAYRLFTLHPPVAVTGDLTAAVGAPMARLPQLLAVAVGSTDSGIRREAVRAMVSVFQADSNLRAATLPVLRGMNDATLADLVRSRAGRRASEIVANIGADATDPYLRARAWRLLRSFAGQPPATGTPERNRIQQAQRFAVAAAAGASPPSGAP
jgi:hypothetical protein